ncbi:uncharacterized protein [Onthophagus taurus]|uniref:uncharacterized protein n=1 Tax=Onthophagus taurus TaxID=166361 RepID=UPI000C20D5D9|nr:uncharacterized protein LOC111414987 [Onthophagus taurus]
MIQLMFLFFITSFAFPFESHLHFENVDRKSIYASSDNRVLRNLEDENDWESLKPVDIFDRSLGDYDTRESPPFQKICEVQFIQVPFWDRDPLYEYKNYPMYNATCVSSDVTNPLSYSRHSPRKDFCIIKHQKIAEEDYFCKTVFRKIPILKRKRGSSCWSYEIEKFGVGCKCHIAIKFD